MGIIPFSVEVVQISDHATAQRVLGQVIETPPEPHNLRPAEAKALLASWMGARSREARVAARRQLADQLDLDTVVGRSRSFQRFLDDLRA